MGLAFRHALHNSSGIDPSTDIPMNMPDFDSMTDGELKVAENRLRRMADRYGYQLRKSPRRDPRAPDFGLFAVIDPRTGGAVNAGTVVNTPFGWSHGEVWRFLMADEPR